MDNLTHSLIGIVAGDTVARSGKAGRLTAQGPAARGLTAEGLTSEGLTSEGLTSRSLTADGRRTFLVTIGVIGGNLPDSDLIVSYGAGGKLAYLLQHRGYTHTIVGCVLLALLLYGAVELFARWRRLAFSRADRVALLSMALFATLLHLGMDSLNSYGVHPFWPFNNDWFYGDSVFIVEPLYWVAAAPMFFLLRTIWARIVLGIALTVALVATVLTYSARPAWYVGIIVLTAVFVSLGKFLSARMASWTSAVATLGVTAMFITAGMTAKHSAEAAAAQDFPSEHLIDHVVSPGFANPFCWDVLMIETGRGQYTVRQATISSSPGALPAGQCFGGLISRVGTAPMTAVAVPSSAAIQWIRQFSMPEDRLAMLAASDCEVRELLQFARVPYATQVAGQWVVGDLRFDRETGLGMSEISLDSRMPARCRFNAPWVPPRAALLVPHALASPE
jgi:inner membrane protein